MKHLMYKIFAVSFAAVVLAGCGEPHRPPPMEHMELTARFFRSVENGQSETAIRQAKKIQTLIPDSSYISTLVAIQEANDTIGAAQSALERSDINQALQIIRDGRRKHSGNRTFAEVYPKINQLRNAQKLFRALVRAKNSSVMRSAQTAARVGLSMNMTPELKKYLEEYEVRSSKLAAKEKAAVAAAERAAKAAVDRAKLEEKKRKAAEQQFEREVNRKSGEGERLRRDNQFPQLPATDFTSTAKK